MEKHPKSVEVLETARNAAQVLVIQSEAKAVDIKDAAEKVALDLVEHAKETARQMLLSTNIDTRQIPLICNKIIKIQSDLWWMKWLLTGVVAGVGYIALQVLVRGLN